jgi:hypothetical protein
MLRVEHAQGRNDRGQIHRSETNPSEVPNVCLPLQKVRRLRFGVHIGADGRSRERARRLERPEIAGKCVSQLPIAICAGELLRAAERGAVNAGCVDRAEHRRLREFAGLCNSLARGAARAALAGGFQRFFFFAFRLFFRAFFRIRAFQRPLSWSDLRRLGSG